jgi:glycosyltransferase involved in cell wall biosynthesis
MNLPKISIITPTFNASKTLKECIESVAIQNYSYLEHWIIDGVSTDNTMEIVKEYVQKYPHIKYISEKDKGIYDAMNKGIELATGDFLLFLGADDFLTKANILNEITQKTFFFDFDIISGKEQQSSIILGKEYDKNKIDIKNILEPFVHYFLPHKTTFIRKTLFNKLGIYDLSYTIAADMNFLVRTLDNPNIKKKFLNEIVALSGAEGLSSYKTDILFEYDFPKLANEFLGIRLNQKNYYRNFAKYYFDEIANKNIIKGLKGIIKIMFVQRDFFYYLKNTLYHLKQRIKYK